MTALVLLLSLAVSAACTGPGDLMAQLPTPSPTASSRVAVGVWGIAINAKMVQMLEVRDTEAVVDFPCAHGLISQPLTLDANGQFAVEGTYTQESGVAPAAAVLPVPARYSGQTDGQTLTLTVTLVDGAVKIGDYTLTFSPTPLPPMPKCM
jgi:hypothetical protein